MKTALKADLERLSRLAYHRLELNEDIVRRFHRLGKAAAGKPDFARCEGVYRWLFVPITLWPMPLDGLCRTVLAAVERGRRLQPRLRLLIDLLPVVPRASVQEAVARHEASVQRGDYEPLVRAQFKYEEVEQGLMSDPEFREQWTKISGRFDVGSFRDYKGIVRRRLVSERSIRADWEFSGKKAVELFHSAFAVFCQRWNLYGMQGDRPLVMKLTANLTPFGTMIFVPTYWSLDPKRDVNWRAITALHKARSLAKQGPKLSGGRRDVRRQAEAAQRLWEEAGARGLKGAARNDWILRKLKLDPRTDERTLRRLRTVRGSA